MEIVQLTFGRKRNSTSPFYGKEIVHPRVSRLFLSPRGLQKYCRNGVLQVVPLLFFAIDGLSVNTV